MNQSFRAFLLALLAFFGISAGSQVLPESSPPIIPAGEIRVHILDVGQGLAVFMETGEHTLLYDGGGSDTSSFVVSYLQKQGVETLDYCIASHYDADHLSGLIGVLNKFEIGTLIAPDYTSDTKTYASFLNMETKKSVDIHSAKVRESFSFGEGTLQVMAPCATEYADENNYSVVVRLTFGESSLLLTGDATTVSEDQMLDSGMDLQTDVLLLGHHGSYNATGEDFFRAVSPEYAILSCAENNAYGHPHTRVMNLLKEHGTKLYRTDLQGSIYFTITGTEIRFDTESCNDYATGDEVSYRNYNQN